MIVSILQEIRDANLFKDCQNIQKLKLCNRKAQGGKDYEFHFSIEHNQHEIAWREDFIMKFMLGLAPMLAEIEADCEGQSKFSFENELDAVYATKLSDDHEWGQVVLPYTSLVFGYYIESKSDKRTYCFSSKIKFFKK